jgi:hypothetical protein
LDDEGGAYCGEQTGLRTAVSPCSDKSDAGTDEN